MSPSTTPSTTLIQPPRLKPGDRIGVISPAGPVDPADMKPELDLLRSHGYRVIEAAHLYDRHDYLAGDDETRLYDLHAMFSDSDIHGIICARGGYGALRLLERIDYDLIRRHPKILVGYSDITALLMAVYMRTGLITCHGPMVRGLSGISPDSRRRFLAVLSSDQPVSFNPLAGNPLIHGTAEGPLLGGNLSLICHLAGTPFLPSFEGCILFIEDRGEPLYRIDRMLTHLALTGELEGIVGLIGGEFIDCGPASEIDRLLTATASRLKIPLVTGFPVGHGENNFTIPFGMPARLDTRRRTLVIPPGSVV